MTVERINTSQADDQAPKKKRGTAKKPTKSNKPTPPKKAKGGGKSEQPTKTGEVSTIGKVWTMAELLAMKRKDLEKVALERGVQNAHLAKNKDDIAAMIGEVDDIMVGELTQKQELFCQLYASDVEFFGNGTQSYMEAYRVPYDVARANASRMLANANVLQRIDEIIASHEMNDQMVDRQIGFWIRQKANPMASIAGIKEYNLLKGRTGKAKDDRPAAIIFQQNNQIHFDSPKARAVIEGFDAWLLANTKAAQPQEGEVNVQPAEIV